MAHVGQERPGISQDYLVPAGDCLQVGSGQLQIADILRILQLAGDGQELEGPDIRALVHPAYNLAVL